MPDVDLTTRYLGLDLANPIVASSSPLTRQVDTMHELVEAGVGAIVLASVFEEEIDDDAHLHGHLETWRAGSSPRRSRVTSRWSRRPTRA